MRIWLLAALMAAPAMAQDVEPHIIQSPVAFVVTSQGDTDGTAKTDPLTQVAEAALKVNFTCADTGCAGASSRLTVEGEAGDSAAITFTPAADGLHASVDGQAYGLVVKQGEAFDLRIHWTDGHRVSFDLYRTDPASGVSNMESHDAQLAAGVQDIAMSASHGTLTLLSQNYLLR